MDESTRQDIGYTGTGGAKVYRYKPRKLKGDLVRFDHRNGQSYYPYQREIAEHLQRRGMGKIREDGKV